MQYEPPTFKRYYPSMKIWGIGGSRSQHIAVQAKLSIGIALLSMSWHARFLLFLSPPCPLPLRPNHRSAAKIGVGTRPELIQLAIERRGPADWKREHDTIQFGSGVFWEVLVPSLRIGGVGRVKEKIRRLIDHEFRYFFTTGFASFHSFLNLNDWGNRISV